MKHVFARLLRRQPIIVAIAGPNGAGKSKFYEAYLSDVPYPYVNADLIARETDSDDPYEAATQAALMRDIFVEQRQSFIFETVLSDPVGDKIDFLRRAEEAGFTVYLCFIGLESPEISEQRVAMRVSQGGHDVPTPKINSRYPRSLENLKRALAQLRHVLVFDNSNLVRPYSLIAASHGGKTVMRARRSLPEWFKGLNPEPKN